MKRGGTVGGAMSALALTALFMFRGPGAGPQSSSQPSRTRGRLEQSKAESKSKATFPEQGPWRASRDHFAGPGMPTEKRSCATTLQQDDEKIPICDPRRDLWLIPDSENVQAMIAVVPDPVHTHLALAFDRTVEALQLAAGTSNYVSDRFWLPWDTSAKPEFSDYDSVKEAGSDRRAKLEQPGLMIFRYDGEIGLPQPLPAAGADHGTPGEIRDAGRAGLLYVFLVADTVAGVNGAQFGRAVTYIRQICRSEKGCVLAGKPAEAGKEAARRIQMMGPMFSGSLASLRRLTQAVPGAEFSAYSGTVSSICAAQDQHLAVGSKDLCNTVITPEELVPWLRFRSFVVDSELAMSRFIEFLRQKGEIDCGSGVNPQVAILSETATTYGAAQQSVGRDNRLPERKRAIGPEYGKKREAGEQYTDDSDERVSASQNCSMNFAYPREISSLRNAYHNSASETSGSVKSGDSSRQYLSFTLNDSQNDDSDDPQDFSGQQGPLSKEAVLMKMGGELRDHHYRYIGIVGTNSLDVLFLSNFLRSAVPNARVFVVNSDLLFERELDNASFVGMMAVSSYPLIARNLYWSNPIAQPDRLPFSDQLEQGQYNATVYLLHEMLPGHHPVTYEMQPPPLSGESSGDPARPAVWLTAVGTGGYWPVRVLEPAAPPTSATAAMTLKKEDFSVAWMCFTLLLCVYSCLQAGVLLWGNPVSSRLRDYAAEEPQSAQRLFFIHWGSAILALALILMAMPAWMSADTGSGCMWWAGVAAVVAAAFLFAACVAREVRWKLRPRPLNWFCGHIAVWVAAAAVALLWALIFREKSGSYGFFFAYRAVHPATGVSPVTPLVPLLAAGYGWSMFEILRLRFSDELRPRLNPDSESAPNGWLAGGTSEAPVARALGGYLLDIKYTAGTLLVFLLWLMFFNPVHPFVLFENWKFGFLYGLFFCLVVLLILSSGFRFGQVWVPLRRMLGEMERSRIRCTFQRLKHSDWSPIWRQGGQETEWLNLARSVEALRALCHMESQSPGGASSLDPVLVEAARKAIDDADSLRTSFLAPKKPGENATEAGAELSRTFKDLQTQMAITLDKTLAVLNEWWQQTGFEPQDSVVSAKEVEVKHSVKEAIHEVAQGVTEESEAAAKKAERRKLRQLARMEEFVAWRYEGFIRTVLGHMKHTLMFLALAFSLVLVSLNLYAFQPHDSLLWSLTMIFIVLGALTVFSLTQIHRDPILSRMSGTTPNDLGWDFYIRIVSFGAAPLITLLATHFPSIGRYVTSFLQPGLEALK